MTCVTHRDPLPLFELRKVVDAYVGPKVAVTEFAAMKGGETIQAAIAEAAFMSALERNCDKVQAVRFRAAHHN